MTSDPGFSHLHAAAHTDVGQRRKNNEDSLVSIPSHGVFCVADGMGGTEAGEVASSRAVKEIEEILHDVSGPESFSRNCELTRKAIHDANLWIWRHAIEKGMKSCGTTVVAMVFDPIKQDRALALHAGDSRAYRLRGGRLVQITADHSFAAASGVKDEMLLPARFRSIITRAVGINDEVEVEETQVDVAEGDIFLLCSDGLTRMVPDDKLTELLKEHGHKEPLEITKILVDAANTAGGHDNITVVLVKVEAITIGEEPGGDDRTMTSGVTASADDDNEAQTALLDIDRSGATGVTGGKAPKVWVTQAEKSRKARLLMGVILLIFFLIALGAMHWYYSKQNVPSVDVIGVEDERPRKGGRGWSEDGGDDGPVTDFSSKTVITDGVDDLKESGAAPVKEPAPPNRPRWEDDQ